VNSARHGDEYPPLGVGGTTNEGAIGSTDPAGGAGATPRAGSGVGACVRRGRARERGGTEERIRALQGTSQEVQKQETSLLLRFPGDDTERNDLPTHHLV